MAWKAKFSKGAERDLARLDKAVRRRVIEKVEWLSRNFESITPLPLTGEYKEFYKLRAGDWRIFYKVNWSVEIITIEYIDHRSKAYK